MGCGVISPGWRTDFFRLLVLSARCFPDSTQWSELPCSSLSFKMIILDSLSNGSRVSAPLRSGAGASGVASVVPCSPDSLGPRRPSVGACAVGRSRHPSRLCTLASAWCPGPWGWGWSWGPAWVRSRPLLGDGQAWFLLGPWAEETPGRSTVGGAVTRGTDWCGSSQVPGRMGLMEDLRRGDRSWSTGRGDPTTASGPAQRHWPAFPKRPSGSGAPLGFYNLLPGFQGSHKGTLAKDSHQVTISACGGGRLRTSHSTVLHHPQKWPLHQDGNDVGPALSVTRVVVRHSLSLPLP